MGKWRCVLMPAMVTGLLMLTACGQKSLPDTVRIENAGEKGIQVSSREKVEVKPDIAEIVYSVYSQASDAQTCQTQNQTDLQAVLDMLKAQGVEEASIQTSNYGLSPIYDWENGKTISGYEMNTEVTISDIPMEQVGTILSQSVDSGINSIESVVYQSSKYDECYQKALEKAISTAKEKAAGMAEAGNCKLGKIANIQEYGGDQQARNNSYQSAGGKENAVADMKVMPGKIEIEAVISVEFEIE